MPLSGQLSLDYDERPLEVATANRLQAQLTRDLILYGSEDPATDTGHSLMISAGPTKGDEATAVLAVWGDLIAIQSRTRPGRAAGDPGAARYRPRSTPHPPSRLRDDGRRRPLLTAIRSARQPCALWRTVCTKSGQTVAVLVRL